MLILSKQQAMLLTSLLAAKPVGITQLVSDLYDGRYDGGPTDPEGCIRVQIYKLRHLLRPSGIHILTMGRNGAFQGYIVDPDHQEKAAAILAEMSVQMLNLARERHKSLAVNDVATAG